MNTNIMIDLKTTGTRPGCCILSIGAVPFLDESMSIEPFYEKISLAASKDLNFKSDPETMAWWSKQEEHIREEAFSGTKDVVIVLSEFSSYLQELPAPPLVWGNGADFDNAILAETYRVMKIPVPWKYNASRCYRTLCALFPEVPRMKLDAAVAHNALADARHKALHAEQIFIWRNRRI